MKNTRSLCVLKSDLSVEFVATQVDKMSPRRFEAGSFIKGIFQEHYAARVNSFTPNLLVLETGRGICAAAGWRGAESEKLFLEHYLDFPVQTVISDLAGQIVERRKIVELAHLASRLSGASVHIFAHLASCLNQSGFEWVVFTATQQLIGIFSKLGLPLFALSNADPSRLGQAANDWGTYYDSKPVVVAGRIKHALLRRNQGEGEWN